MIQNNRPPRKKKERKKIKMKIDFYFDKPLRVVSPNFETSFIG